MTEGAIYALAAMGVVFTYKVSRVVNFAFGATAMFCAFCYWQLRVEWGVPPVIALPIVLLALPTALALVTERLVYRRLQGSSSFAKIAASIGVFLAFYGVTLYFWHGPILLGTLKPPSLFPAGFFRIPGAVVTDKQVGIVLCLVVIVLALFAYLRFTRSGLHLRAVVTNRNLAELRGIDSIGVTRASWIISYVLSSLAGLLLAAFTGSDPDTLTLIVIYALAAAALGGLVSLPWAAFGGLVLGLADQLMQGYLSQGAFVSQLRLAVPFAVLFLALILLAKKLGRSYDAQDRTAHTADLAGAATARRPNAVPILIRVGVLLVVIFILQGIGDTYVTTLLATGVATAIIMLSYRMLTATTGIVSLAQAGFAGIGAFTAANLIHSWHLPWAIAVIGAGVVAGASGAIMAWPTARLRGIFLTIASLAFAQLIVSVLFSGGLSLTGGLYGLAIPLPTGFHSATSYLYLLVVLFVVIGLLCEVFQYSVMGLELQADLSSPAGTRSIGISAGWARIVAFTLSAFVAGVGGALLSSQIQFVSIDGWGIISPAFVWLILVAVAGLGSTALMLQIGIFTAVFPAIIMAWVPSLDQGYVAIFGVLGLAALRIPGGTLAIEQRMKVRMGRLFARLSRGNTADPHLPQTAESQHTM